MEYNLIVKVVYCNIVESWSEGSTQYTVLLRIDPPPSTIKLGGPFLMDQVTTLTNVASAVL